MAAQHDSIAADYARDGFYFPLDVIDAAHARALLADLEHAEAELAGDVERLALLAAYPDRLLPTFDALVRHPELLTAVTAVLVPDLMVWSAGLFSKQANTRKRVFWHQDLTYWGLDDVQEITAWVALSPSSIASGCMQFLPGSHQRQLVAHRDAFDNDNLLTRGQEIAEAIAVERAVAVLLEPGQASLHHGHLFHASGPNTSDYRRVGAAIRYIRPTMQQLSGDRSLVALVSGEDRWEHFTVADTPRERLAEEDFERCRADAAIKRRVLYSGADPGRGKRYT